jgi:hypothetical protein
MIQSHAEGFALTKWYIDCVDSTGRAGIAYWASLSWRTVALTWHSVSVYEPGGAPLERTSLVPVRAPEHRDGVITWRTRALDSELECTTRSSPIAVRLLDQPCGTIDWRCEAPASRNRLEVAGHAPLLGCGYAEQLVLTALPWRLPIDELRWGRWISADAEHSVIWIDWRGEMPRTWLFVDGVERHGATVSDADVVAGDSVLTLNGRRTLHARALGDVIGSIPALGKLLPAPLFALSETKWCSNGTFRDRDVRPLGGWAIHEVARFR